MCQPKHEQYSGTTGEARRVQYTKNMKGGKSRSKRSSKRQRQITSEIVLQSKVASRKQNGSKTLQVMDCFQKHSINHGIFLDFAFLLKQSYIILSICSSITTYFQVQTKYFTVVSFSICPYCILRLVLK